MAVLDQFYGLVENVGGNLSLGVIV